MQVVIIPPVVKDPKSGEYVNYQIPAAEYHTVCEMINRCTSFVGSNSGEYIARITMGEPDEVGKVHHTIVIYQGEPSFETRAFAIGALRRSWDAKLEFHS